MSVASQPPSRPPGDPAAWDAVDATMRRHGFDAHALIESLHAVQKAFGYLSPEAMRYVAACLRLPPAKVFGVATFYHFFTLHPPAKHACVICLGTTCYIHGAGQLLDAVTQRFALHTGETTPDSALALLGARCIGTCGLAPTAILDGQVVGREAAPELIRRIERRLTS